MIGFFDSGFGGLTALRAATKALPTYDYAYLGDTARAPYGSRSVDVVRRFTFEGVHTLVTRGARIVVLACNSASSLAWPWVAERFPDVPVLSIIPPTVRLATRATKTGRVGLAATNATVSSGAYAMEFAKCAPHVRLTAVACPLIVPFVEEGMERAPELLALVKQYVAPLKRAQIDTLILGCTHYPIVKALFQKALGPRVKIISSSDGAALALREYLDAHPEFATTLPTNATRTFFTTDTPERFDQFGTRHLRQPVAATRIRLTREPTLLLPEPIGILGFGVEGRGTYEYLKKHGARAITIFDRNADAAVPVDTTAQLGDAYLTHLSAVRTIFRSPGVRPVGLAFDTAKAAGVRFTSELNFFLERAPTSRIIGVTGTKGKGTTSTLIRNILQRAGRTVFLGGNIGVPPFEFLDQLTPDDWVVLELSSFQLMDVTRSPHIAVLLKTVPEHLDWHADYAEYLAAKKNLVTHQRAGDYFIGHADSPATTDFAAVTPAHVLTYSRLAIGHDGFLENGALWIHAPHTPKSEWVAKIGAIGLKGAHNYENILAASLATTLAGVDLETIRTEIREFHGLPHRLETVGIVDGIEYVNDSFATTPETAAAALASFPHKNGVVLIAGGVGKGTSFAPLAVAARETRNLRGIVLIGRAAEEIRGELQKIGVDVPLVDGGVTMTEMVDRAAALARAGDAVLLSPACASFDLFRDYKDRGEQFRRCIAG